MRSTLIVLFDGHCPLCQRTVRILRRIDVLKRLSPVDFRTADLSSLEATHGVSLDPARLEREMIVIKSGRAYGGSEAVRVIAGALPALWPVWPFLAVPGLSHVSSAIYKVVARNRMSLLKCNPTGACALPTRFEPAIAPIERPRLAE